MNNHKASGSIFLLALAGSSMAQLNAFTPGKLCYVRLNNNVAFASNISYAMEIVSLNKTGLTQTGTSLGSLTSSSSGIVHSGTATSELSGFTTLDSRFAVIAGYRGPAGSTASAPSTLNRVAARMPFTGNGDYTTTRNAGATQAIRYAISDAGYNIWSLHAQEGIFSNTFGGTSSGVQNLATTPNIRVAQFLGDRIAYSVAGSISFVSGRPTNTGNSSSTITLSTGGTMPSSIYGFVFMGDPVNGPLTLYTAQDNGAASNTSSGIAKWVSPTGINGTFTLQYNILNPVTAANGWRSLCTDGKVLYASGQGGAGNFVSAIIDTGTTFVHNQLSATMSNTPGSSVQVARGVFLAPSPTVVDSDYTTGGTGENAVAGNVMTLRQSNGYQRSLRVGLVPDSNYRSWTDFATINYDGEAVKTAVDTDGNTYVLVQSSAIPASTIVPTVQVTRVSPSGTVLAGAIQNLPAGSEAYGITIDSSNRPVVAYRTTTATPDTKFVRWSADLATASDFSSGIASGTKTPIDISSDPNGYITALFATGNTLSTTAIDNTFAAGTVTSDVTVADDAGVALTPLSAQFGTDVDTLATDRLSFETLGQPERRDATGTSTGGVLTRAATSPSFLWAWGLSMAGNNPRVLMTGTAEPTAGPSGPGSGTANRNDNIIGSGRVWTFSTANVVSNATYRFAPGFSPVN
jgi:hypothetical protein